MKIKRAEKTNLKVDFAANSINNRFYIQSALTISEEDKRLQEIRPYKHIPDSFAKIIVIKDDIIPWHDENGILYIGIEEFLSDKNIGC